MCLYFPKPNNLMKLALHLNPLAANPIGTTPTHEQVITKIKAIFAPYEMEISDIKTLTMYHCEFFWLLFSPDSQLLCRKMRIDTIVRSMKTTILTAQTSYDRQRTCQRILLVGRPGRCSRPLASDRPRPKPWSLGRLQPRVEALPPRPWPGPAQYPRYVHGRTSHDGTRRDPDGCKDNGDCCWDKERGPQSRPEFDQVHRNKILNMGIGIEYFPSELNARDLALVDPPIKAIGGVRAPDARVQRLIRNGAEDEIRLYDLFGDARRFAIIVFVGDLANRESVDKLRRAEAAALVVRDPVNREKFPFMFEKSKVQLEWLMDHKGEAHERFGAGPELTTEGAVVVVRPDDYVGTTFRIDDFECVERYFDGFLIQA
ncbi:hypothetical protein BC938DRAFT_475682 [Jimgerdemannia flammicorona]|uniref:Phenol hydroxylase-like C-terminal dimerisation domain-containing protein n=1 Tax=Jimgerdemannia flammicorona TaxID=994334 RepID=A0A433PQ61_9FUNG|nr:hypothetical protein BC938DRAFT_475682 [Jimgerdemannia flammicorona]